MCAIENGRPQYLLAILPPTSHRYVVDRERPQCLPVTWYAEGQETHQFWRNFPDPPPLADNSKITNNYDKYASSYIDVDTNSCVTPSTAWCSAMTRSHTHAVHMRSTHVRAHVMACDMVINACAMANACAMISSMRAP